MYFKLGTHLFSSKTFMNFMLIILTALSFVITNLCLGIYNRQNDLLDSVAGFDKDNDCYFMYNAQELFTITDDGELIETILTEEYFDDIVDNDDFSLGYIYGGKSYIQSQQAFQSSFEILKYVTFYAFDDYTLDCLNYGQLLSGTWCTEAKTTDGYLNVVALEGVYDVGDTFIMELEYTDTDDSYETITVPCIVTGVISGGSHMYSSSNAGDGVDISMLLPGTYTDREDGERSVIYFSYEDEAIRDIFDTYIANGKSEYLIYDCFLHFDDTISDNEMYKIKENLSREGWLLSIGDICANTEDEILEQALELVPFMFGVFLLTIICLICMMTLNAIDHMKTYAVYYLCGMNWSDMKKILLSYALIVLSLSAVLFLILFAAIITTDSYSGITLFRANNIYVTAAMLLVILLVFVFVPYILLVHSSPKDALRNTAK